MALDTGFVSISNVLDDLVFDKQKMSFTIKKAVAFGFWKNISGNRFAPYSFPYDIKGQTLMVSVKNPQIMQELIFLKNEILTKTNNYFSPLGFNINEIRYNYKNYNEMNNAKTSYKENEDNNSLDEKEIDKIELTNFEKEVISNVTDTISKLDFMDEKLKTKYSKNILNSIKAKKLREMKNQRSFL